MSATKEARKICQERGCQTPWRDVKTKRCYRHRPGQREIPRPPVVCNREGCGNVALRAGRCNTCQYQDYLKLQPDALDQIELALMRWFEATDDGCWIYTHQAMTDDAGYGRFLPDGNWAQVHKWVYMHLAGPVPDGHQLHHECRVRNCARPGHLTPMTPEEHSKVTAAAQEFDSMFPGAKAPGPDRSHTDRERVFAAVYNLPADTTVTEQDLGTLDLSRPGT